MFTLKHFIWIGISIVLILALLFITLKLKLDKKKVFVVVTVIAILSELLKIFTHIELEYNDDGSLYRGFISPGSLPLHLCSIFVFVFIFLNMNKNEELEKKIISFFVPIGLFGGILAILMATSGTDFSQPYAYQCFVYHSGMVYAALYFVITKQVDLGLKAYIRNVLLLFFLAIIMIWVNGALSVYDTNFFFVVRPPAANLPILNLNHGWYVYFLSLCIIGILLETIISLPYIIKEKKNKKLDNN